MTKLTIKNISGLIRLRFKLDKEILSTKKNKHILVY